VRWWDGHRWYDPNAPVGPVAPSKWQLWFTTSGTSLLVEQWLAVGAGAAAVVTGSLVIYALLGGGPVPYIAFALVLGTPLLAVGQLWAIGLINARSPSSRRNWRERKAAQLQVWANPRRFFFPALPNWAAYSLFAVLMAGWLAALTAFPALTRGDPVAATPGCPWPLNDHGTITCVSHATYQQVGVAGERFASGILFCFFALHFGVLTSEVIRRRGR